MDREWRSKEAGKLCLLPTTYLLLTFHSNKTFRRLLTKSDLDRYLFYGKKMRKLVTSSGRNDLSNIDGSVFRAVSIFLDLFYPGRTVMPHLREFKWDSGGQLDLMWEIFPYLSPSIQRIEMELDSKRIEPGSPALALLSTLASKWPFIKQLHLYGEPDYRTPIESTFPCGFLHLSSFRCPYFPISCDAIRHLAHLPNLCDASLYFSHTDASGWSTLAVPARPFPSLRELYLCGTRFRSGIEFIQTYLLSVSLNSIDIRAEDAPSAGEIHEFFSALSSRLCPQTLTSINLNQEEYMEYDIGPALEFCDFEPLLRCNNLETLSLEIAFSPERLSDSLLEAMSFAWPQLTKLEFDSRLFNDLPSPCTFRGILHLAKRCPRLFSLSISFMAFAKISWNDRPGGGSAINQNLKHLYVGKSLIDDSGMVASLLSDIFPNIEKIWASIDYDSDDDEQCQNYDQWQVAIKQYMEKRAGGASGT
jgi:hypothetical protein